MAANSRSGSLIPSHFAVAGGNSDFSKQLPAGSIVVETASLGVASRPDLSLILWMIDPKRQVSTAGPNEAYTCPEETRGSHYRGPTRVSLYDRTSDTIVNTIEIRNLDLPDEDIFDIPFRLRAGFYYRVIASGRAREGTPRIMDLRDVNGDGKALEFVLFDKTNCSKLLTTLVGYSERQHRVIQYPIDLLCDRGGRVSRETWYWIDYLFAERGSGSWRYDLRYHGPPLHFEVRFDPAAERFVGTYVEGGADKR